MFLDEQNLCPQSRGQTTLKKVKIEGSNAAEPRSANDGGNSVIERNVSPNEKGLSAP